MAGDPGIDDRDGPPQRRLIGGSVFTLEGRAAPGLYLVGWLATVMGLAILAVAILSATSGIAGFALTFAGAGLLSVGLIAAAGSQAMERGRRAAGPERAEATPGEPAGYHGPSPFLVFAASLPLTILLALLAFVPARPLGFDPASPAGTLVSVLLTAIVYAGLIRLVVVGTGALDWHAMGLGRRGAEALADLAWGAMLALPIILVTTVLAALLVGLIGVEPQGPLPPARDGAGMLANLVAAAIVAPIGEELFFRGFATTAWARSMGADRAILRGGLFFAVVHVLTIGGATFGEAVGRAFIAFVGRLPVSFALGWVFLRRRSLWASIGLHASFNGLLVVLGELAARSIGLQ